MRNLFNGLGGFIIILAIFIITLNVIDIVVNTNKKKPHSTLGSKKDYVIINGDTLWHVLGGDTIVFDPATAHWIQTDSFPIIITKYNPTKEDSVYIDTLRKMKAVKGYWPPAPDSIVKRFRIKRIK